MVVEPHTLSARYLLDFDHDLNPLDGRRAAECGSIHFYPLVAVYKASLRSLQPVEDSVCWRRHQRHLTTMLITRLSK